MTTTYSFSIARFTYVPPEHYDSIEMAFSSKPLADWITMTPHSHLTLQVQQSYDSVLLKCLDGHDIRVPLSSPFYSFLPAFLYFMAWLLSVELLGLDED